MTNVRVTCPNGHSEDFSSADAASSYVEYGHACVAMKQHTIEIVNDEQLDEELAERLAKHHAYQKSVTA